eukprot:gene12165-14239_t
MEEQIHNNRKHLDEFGDQHQTDPAKIGWMVGAPPPNDKLICFIPQHNHFPRYRWSFAHIRELVPTHNVWHGRGPASVLQRQEENIEEVSFTLEDGSKHSFKDMMDMTYTDGLLVLHKGKVLYEKYFGVMNDHQPHLAMSVTKSFIGTMAAILVHEQKIDDTALVTKYLPEMANTAYCDATVRQVMDMTAGVKYSEDYGNPEAEIWNYSQAAGSVPRLPNYKAPKTIYEFLGTLKKEGQHGDQFSYKTINTEVLAWIIRRVLPNNQTLSDYLSERIWSKMGAENDAYFMVDSIGTESCGGGYNTTLQDLARFGEMMRNRGFYNGQQVIPVEVVDDIMRGGDKDKFAMAGHATLPGWSYRSMWWVGGGDDVGELEARGIHGQRIYINHPAELTIVRYASHPIAFNAANDLPTHGAYRALARHLMNKMKN